MAWIAETLKKVGTIQPGQCECLPEMMKHMLVVAIEEKLKAEKGEQEWSLEIRRLAPLYAQNQADLLKNNEQYQRGMVTAREITKYWTQEAFEEMGDSIDAYKYLLSMIEKIPTCLSLASFSETIEKEIPKKPMREWERR